MSRWVAHLKNAPSPEKTNPSANTSNKARTAVKTGLRQKPRQRPPAESDWSDSRMDRGIIHAKMHRESRKGAKAQRILADKVSSGREHRVGIHAGSDPQSPISNPQRFRGEDEPYRANPDL